MKAKREERGRLGMEESLGRLADDGGMYEQKKSGKGERREVSRRRKGRIKWKNVRRNKARKVQLKEEE